MNRDIRSDSEELTWPLAVAPSGPSSGCSFWHRALIFVIGLVLADVYDAVLALLTLYLLGTLMPTLAAIVRRLHDTNQGFWWLPLGVGVAPVAFVLGALGVQFMGVGLLGWIFVRAVDGDTQGTAAELENLFELGVALFGLGVLTGIAGGVLAIVLLVFLVSPSTRGENKYGPQPD